MRHRAAAHLVQHRADHMRGQLVGQPFAGGLGVVLRGDQHGVHAHRTVMFVVLDGHLRLAVRTQMGHDALLAHLGQPVRQPVGQVDRQRHQRVGLVAGVAEHHALVAGALRLVALLAAGGRLPFAIQPFHTLVDLRALFGQRHQHAAGVGVQTDPGAGVPDAAHRGAHDALDVAVALAGDLAEYEELSGGGRGLHGHVGVRVLAQHVVQDRVRDLVADLVGVALGHRFRRDQPWFIHP